MQNSMLSNGDYVNNINASLRKPHKIIHIHFLHFWLWLKTIETTFSVEFFCFFWGDGLYNFSTRVAHIAFMQG